MAILTAQRAVNTRDLPELEKIKDSNFDLPTQQGQYSSNVSPPFANSTSYRFDPHEIDLISNVGVPGDLDWLLGTTFGGTFRKIAVRDIDGLDKIDAYTITGFELELDTDLWADAQDGKLDTVPAKMLQGDDELNGSDFDDILFAFAGEDVVEGGDGDDEIDGGADRDGLNGGDGDDAMSGGTGDDDLTGGRGADTQSGGDGADTFFYSSILESTRKKDGRDTILDFDRSEDDGIHLTAIDARKGKGNQDFTFIKKQEFSDTKGELRYKVKNGDAWVQGDTDGNGKADFVIVVADLTKLKGGDFDL